MSRSGSRSKKKIVVVPHGLDHDDELVVGVTRRARPARPVRSRTKTARRNPLERARKPRPNPTALKALSLEPDKRQYLEPQELLDFFAQLPAPTTPTLPSASKGYVKLLHTSLPPPSATYWRAFFFLQFFYGLKVSEPALVKESDVNVKKAKIKLKRLKKGRDPIDGDEQREQRAKALRANLRAKGVRRWKKESEFLGGYDECTYAMPECVAEVVKNLHEWRKEKKMWADNPFLFASSRYSKKDAGFERQSHLRNDGGYRSVSRSTVNRVFRTLATNAKWPEHLRECRSVPALKHTRAVFMLAAGVPLEEVRDLLGHTPRMTERYLPVAQALRDKFGAEEFAAFGKDKVEL